MKKAKMLIFDFDGTIIPSTVEGMLKVQSVLKAVGLPAADNELIRKHWGEEFNKLSRLICKSVGATEEQIQKFQELEKDFPVAYNFNLRIMYKLRCLRHKGYFLALATSRDRNSLVRICEIVKCDLGVFHHVQASEDNRHHKPDGRVFDKIVAAGAKDGYAPRIVYFGDTVRYDREAARNSGHSIKFVAVTSGVNTRSEFQQAGVSRRSILRSVDHVPEFLEKHFLQN